MGVTVLSTYQHVWYMCVCFYLSNETGKFLSICTDSFMLCIETDGVCCFAMCLCINIDFFFMHTQTLGGASGIRRAHYATHSTHKAVKQKFVKPICTYRIVRSKYLWIRAVGGAETRHRSFEYLAMEWVNEEKNVYTIW